MPGPVLAATVVLSILAAIAYFLGRRERNKG